MIAGMENTADLAPRPETGPGDLDRARVELGTFVTYRAHEAAARLGFSYRPDPLAPDTYDDLVDAHRACEAERRPLPVSSLFCQETIYPTAEENLAFRFWHDTEHVRLGMDFSPPMEFALAFEHLADAEAAGFGPDTLVWALLYADTVGQSVACSVLQRFPTDQPAFVTDCVRLGVVGAVRAESRRG